MTWHIDTLTKIPSPSLSFYLKHTQPIFHKWIFDEQPEKMDKYDETKYNERQKEKMRTFIEMSIFGCVCMTIRANLVRMNFDVAVHKC